MCTKWYCRICFFNSRNIDGEYKKPTDFDKYLRNGNRIISAPQPLDTYTHDNNKEVLFEGYAPHGIAVVIETATDNNNRTVANVRAAFNKCDGNFGTSGSVVFDIVITLLEGLSNNSTTL